MATAKIGFSTLFCLSETFKKMNQSILAKEKAYVEIVDEGFHALNKRRVEILNELASSYSLKYTVHAPFADINIASPSRSLLKAMLKRLKRSIIWASALNCQVWVFHPGLKTGISLFYPSMEWTQNLKTTRVLVDFAADHNVQAAIENVPAAFPFVIKTLKDFKRFYCEVDRDIGFAFDIGHANLSDQTESFLAEFANKIVHIHAHDNHGKIDEHLGIGRGTADWKKIINLLKRINYNEIVIIESIERVEESMQKLAELFA